MKRFLVAVVGFLGLVQGCFAAYHSQYGQDQYVNEVLYHNMRDGVFVDIGAFDGVAISNTLFFEKELGWKGICVEPDPDKFQELKKNRECICIEGCVSDTSGESKYLKLPPPCAVLGGLIHKYDPRHVERVNQELRDCGGTSKEITVQCYTFNDLMKNNGIDHIHFLSIDTEGGELEILSSIDFSRCLIDAITVEDNYGDARFIQFLEGKGFACTARLGCDLMFVRKLQLVQK
jgi:FkbM family methyltransferase